MFSIWLIVATVLLFFFAIACVYAVIVWIRRRRHTKERFAFAALSAITVLTTALFAAVVGQTMPWQLVAAGLSWLTGQEVTLPSPGFADYGLLVAVYIFALVTIRGFFHRWDGLRSERQYELEQRRETMSLFIEGLKEGTRIVQRGEPLRIHEAGERQLTSQLEGSTSSIAWRDRARELVRVKYSYYAFAAESDWHEQARCWVGHNLNTNDLVLLRCSSESPSETEVRDFIEYAERLRSDYGNARVDLMIAVEDENAAVMNELNGTAIHFETEATLLNQLVDWTDYRNEIRKRMRVDQLPDSTLTIADVYVQPRFAPVGWEIKVAEGQQPSDKLEGYLGEWLNEPGQRQFALLGAYGQGKSTAALAFTHKLMEAADASRIPILIELRGTSPRNLTPLQLLGAWSSKYNINPKALLHLHIAGRLLLIFEGFDEMALVGDAEMRLKHFKTLWEFCYPRSKIIITGRPNFFFDEEEMIASLGIGESVAGKPYCRALRLEPFEVPQVETALRKHEKRLRDEITSFAKENDRFQELISRPSLLHIVSVLWDREELSTKLERLTSAYVMKLFIRHSYRRQGLKEADSPEFMALTTEERQYFMKGVATIMAAKQLPNQISGNQLNEIVNALVDAIPEQVSMRTSAIIGEVRQPLRDRLKDAEHGLEHVQTDVRTCGILVDDPAAPGTFRFGHKSFMEYLFAQVVADRIVEDELPDAVSILDACKSTPSDISYLPVSIEFLSEMLGTTVDPSEPTLSQKELARRILRILLGGNWVTFAMGRFELYRRSATRSTRNMRTILRMLITPFVDPMTYVVWISLCTSNDGDVCCVHDGHDVPRAFCIECHESETA